MYTHVGVGRVHMFLKILWLHERKLNFKVFILANRSLELIALTGVERLGHWSLMSEMDNPLAEDDDFDNPLHGSDDEEDQSGGLAGLDAGGADTAMGEMQRDIDLNHGEAKITEAAQEFHAKGIGAKVFLGLQALFILVGFTDLVLGLTVGSAAYYGHDSSMAIFVIMGLFLMAIGAFGIFGERPRTPGLPLRLFRMRATGAHGWWGWVCRGPQAEDHAAVPFLFHRDRVHTALLPDDLHADAGGGREQLH